METLTPPRWRRRRIVIAALTSGALALGLSAMALTMGSSPASAANVSIEQCNNIGNTPVNCIVSVVNTLTNDPGTTGSVVTINGVVSSSGDLVTSVNQCNGSSNGGGAGVTCSVSIVNNIAMDAPAAATPATVNQCVGSGLPIGLATCTPYPATTSDATITQCNGSGNGGTFVAAFSFCTATGTVSASLPVTVNQCNDSANGGGNIVACSTTITTNVVDTTPVTTPTTTPVTTPGSTPTTTPGSTPTTTPGTTPGSTPGTTPGAGSSQVGTPGSGDDSTPGTQSDAPGNDTTVVLLFTG